MYIRAGRVSNKLMIEMPCHIIPSGRPEHDRGLKACCEDRAGRGFLASPPTLRVSIGVTQYLGLLPTSPFPKMTAMNPHFPSSGLLDIVMRLLPFSYQAASFFNRVVGGELGVA